MTLPLCRANAHLRKKGAAIIGAAAPADYAENTPAHLIFSDGEALKALYRKNITLRGDPRSGEYLRTAAVVFRMLHMPLGAEPVLGDASSDGYRIRVAEHEDRFLRLYLTHVETGVTTEIMMGTHGVLTRRGVRLPKINMEQRYKKNEKCHVVYLAFDRCFHLAYAAEYL